VPADQVAVLGVLLVIAVAKAKNILFIPNGALPEENAVEEIPAINRKREDATPLASRNTRNKASTQV
jgi:hypothetical protein